MSEMFEEPLGLGYAGGSASPQEVQDALPQAWQETLNDPQERTRLAAALQLPEEALVDLPDAPFQLRQARANIDPALVDVTIAVAAWIGLNVFAKAGAELAKDAVKNRMRAAWVIIEPKLRRVLKFHGALGDRKDIK